VAANRDSPDARPLATSFSKHGWKVCLQYPGQGNPCPLAPDDAVIKVCFFDPEEHGAYRECAFWWRRLAEERDRAIKRLRYHLQKARKSAGIVLPAFSNK